jgi:hypothetical protein
MATYIMLGSFTDQGIRNVKDTTKRADAVKESAKKFGVNMKEICWTMGQYDMVVTIEAPDDAGVFAGRDERDPEDALLTDRSIAPRGTRADGAPPRPRPRESCRPPRSVIGKRRR